MRGYGLPREGRARDWLGLAADAVGTVIEFWGFKRNHGRVWALLYLRQRPLSAAEIQAELRLSKGGVSMITRDLERWGVVDRVRTSPGEPWKFVAEEDLLEMVRRVLREREATVVARVRADLAEAERRVLADRTAPRAAVARLQRMRRLADVVHGALSMFLRTARLDARAAAEVLRIKAA